MGPSRSRRAKSCLFGCVGLASGIACTACGLISGLDQLQKTPCVDVCGDGSDLEEASTIPDSSSADDSYAPRDAYVADDVDDSGDSPSVIDATEGSDATDASDLDSAADRADSPPSRSIVEVQALAPGWVASSSTELTLDESAGDLLVAGVYGVNSAATFAVTDSLGNVWTATAPQLNLAANCQSGGAGTVAQIFFAEAIAGGENVVKVEQSGTVALGAFLLEYSGVRAHGSLDGVSGRVPASPSLTMNAGEVNTIGALDVVVALFADGQVGTGTMTAGPGFAAEGNDKGFFSIVEDDLPAGTVPATITPTATRPAVGQANCWAATAAAFAAQ